MQKVLYSCFRLLDIVPDNPLAKLYFHEFNISVAHVRKTSSTDALKYDLELEELSDNEMRGFFKNHAWKKEVKLMMYEFNRRKRNGSKKIRFLRFSPSDLGYDGLREYRER